MCAAVGGSACCSRSTADLQQPQQVSKAAVQNACRKRQLEQLQTAATREGASKLQHYTLHVFGGSLATPTLGTCAAYLTAVCERSKREALTHLGG